MTSGKSVLSIEAAGADMGSVPVAWMIRVVNIVRKRGGSKKHLEYSIEISAKTTNTTEISQLVFKAAQHSHH